MTSLCVNKGAAIWYSENRAFYCMLHTDHQMVNMCQIVHDKVVR